MKAALGETRNLRDASRLAGAAMQDAMPTNRRKGPEIRQHCARLFRSRGDGRSTAAADEPAINAIFIHRQTLAGPTRSHAELGEGLERSKPRLRMPANARWAGACDIFERLSATE